MPGSDAATDDVVYAACLFGQGVFAKGVAPLNGTVRQGGSGTEGVEIHRDALASDRGLINRRRYILRPCGEKFTMASVAGNSPTNAQLEMGVNWTRVFGRKAPSDHNFNC